MVKIHSDRYGERSNHAVQLWTIEKSINSTNKGCALVHPIPLLEVRVFFDSCKLVIERHADYLAFINHYSDLFGDAYLYSYSDDEYPVWACVYHNGVEYITDESEYNKIKLPRTDIREFISSEYILSHHFRCRFEERFDKVSNTRMKKLVSVMLTRGTWLKRKDSIKLIKYKKTSDYVLYSCYEDKKTYYLIVLTDGNILTTIYEFDIKDLKYFKEI